MANKKDKPSKILLVVTILSTCITILSGTWGLFKSIENSQLKDSYQIQCTTTKEIVDKNGNLVKTIQNISLSYEDMKNSKDSTIQQLLVQLNQKDISKIKENIKTTSLFSSTKISDTMGDGAVQESYMAVIPPDTVKIMVRDTIKIEVPVIIADTTKQIPKKKPFDFLKKLF